MMYVLVETLAGHYAVNELASQPGLLMLWVSPDGKRAAALFKDGEVPAPILYGSWYYKLNVRPLGNGEYISFDGVLQPAVKAYAEDALFVAPGCPL